MKKLITKIFNIGLFDGEGAVAGGESGSPAQMSTEDKGDLSKVVYGKQPEGQNNINPDAEDMVEEVQKTDSKADLKKKYDDFMKDEDMKKIHDSDIQNIINRRFKETKGYQEKLLKQDEVLNTLYSKYKVKDIEGLKSAIESDDAFWEQEALDAGMSVEQYKEYNKIMRKNQEYQKIFDQQQRRAAAENQYNLWIDEAEKLKAEYPEFDLNTELQNPDFVGLLSMNNPQYSMSMKQIYEICHLNDIKGNIAKETAASTQKRVVDNIRVKGQRPQEGAISGTSGVIVRDDVSKLSKRDRQEIARRALRGEVISF